MFSHFSSETQDSTVLLANCEQLPQFLFLLNFHGLRLFIKSGTHFHTDLHIIGVLTKTKRSYCDAVASVETLWLCFVMKIEVIMFCLVTVVKSRVPRFYAEAVRRSAER